MDKGTSNREQYIHKFCTQLDKDIAELDKDAKEIKNEAQVFAMPCHINYTVCFASHLKFLDCLWCVCKSQLVMYHVHIHSNTHA